MAGGDYRSCDVCGHKVFYDANLNYETGSKIGGKWVYPTNAAKEAGVEQPYGYALDYLGDWAVLCNKCSKTRKCQIVEIDAAIASQEQTK